MRLYFNRVEFEKFIKFIRFKTLSEGRPLLYELYKPYKLYELFKLYPIEIQTHNPPSSQPVKKYNRYSFEIPRKFRFFVS